MCGGNTSFIFSGKAWCDGGVLPRIISLTLVALLFTIVVIFFVSSFFGRRFGADYPRSATLSYFPSRAAGEPGVT